MYLCIRIHSREAFMQQSTVTTDELFEQLQLGMWKCEQMPTHDVAQWYWRTWVCSETCIERLKDQDLVSNGLMQLNLSVNHPSPASGGIASSRPCLSGETRYGDGSHPPPASVNPVVMQDAERSVAHQIVQDQKLMDAPDAGMNNCDYLMSLQPDLNKRWTWCMIHSHATSFGHLIWTANKHQRHAEGLTYTWTAFWSLIHG
jgi:hypothetical protein